jgi:hypothetical protein
MHRSRISVVTVPSFVAKHVPSRAFSLHRKSVDVLIINAKSFLSGLLHELFRSDWCTACSVKVPKQYIFRVCEWNLLSFVYFKKNVKVHELNYSVEEGNSNKLFSELLSF